MLRVSVSSPFVPAFGAVLLLIVLAEAMGAAGWVAAPHRFLHLDPSYFSPFFTFAVGAVFLCHCRLQGCSGPVFAAVMTGMILFAFHVALGVPGSHTFLRGGGLAVYCLGLGSTLILGWQSLRGRSDAWAALQTGWLPGLFVILSCTGLDASVRYNPETFDGALLHFDASLGVQPSIVMARMLAVLPGALQVSSLAYAVLPLLVAILHVRQASDLRHAGEALHAFLLAAVLGFALYFVYPAAGPRYLLGEAFPWGHPDISMVALAPAPLGTGFRNAVPSLHMTWALLLWLGARQLGRAWAVVMAVFAGLTVVATLGLGEHYLVDLVVACPLVVLVHVGVTCRTERLRRMIPAFLLLGCWLVYLALGSAWFASVGRWHWLAIFLTLGLCWRWVRPRAAQPHSQASPALR